jgi:ribosomal protein L18
VSSSSARKARRSKGRKNGFEQKRAVPEAPPARSEQDQGDLGRPAAAVGHRSSKNISVQLIDDVKGVTVAAASSLEKELGVVGKNNVEAAAKVGAAIAERAKEGRLRRMLLRPRWFPLSREDQGFGRCCP